MNIRKFMKLDFAMLLMHFVTLHGVLLITLAIPQQIEGAESEKNESLPPTLKFTQVGNDWRNLTLENGKHSFYSDRGDDLFISCQAPYPIQWNITGVISPPEIVKIQPPRNHLLDNIYSIQINIFFLDAENFPGLAASAAIACEAIGQTANRQEVYVFVKGNNPLITPFEDIVSDSNLIPCPTTDPTTSTSLYLKDDGGSEVLVQDAKYNPIKGFQSKDAFNGDYVCRKDVFYVSISARKSALNSDHQFAPTSANILKFSDEAIEIKCSSNTKTVALIFDQTEKTTVSYTVNSEREKIAKLSVAKKSTAGKNGDEIISGKVACVGGDELIKEWTYEFIKNPELYLDNIEGEADCLSALSPKMVQSVRCKNSMDCDFMSQCLRDRSLCNFKKQKQFYAETNTFCWVDELKKGTECVSVPFSHLNGIVQCSVRGLTRRWEFFISLDYVRYSNWKDAPKRELVRVEELESPNPSGNSKFLCSAVAYLFADSLTFQLEYKDGTRELINADKNEYKTQETSRQLSQSPRRIFELNIKAMLDMRLPDNVVAVHCIAPFWNSTEQVIASKSLRRRRMGIPDLLQTTEEKKIEKFKYGEENRKLTCVSSKENVGWFILKLTEIAEMEQNATYVFPELKLEEEEGGKLHLIFPKVEKKYTGEYQCFSLDAPEEILAEYKVIVVEDLKTSTATYIGLVIILLIIAALLMTAFIQYFRKRKVRSING